TCCVVNRFGLEVLVVPLFRAEVLDGALTAKIGVPVNPNRWYFLNDLVIAACMEPNWLRWHSSKTITTCWRETSLSGFALIKLASLWIVEMIIVAVGSSN